MSTLKKTVYTDEPIGRIKIVKDFLPSPSELAKRQKTVKVTLALTASTLDFFKQTAQSHHTPYQKMIRNLLDEYTMQHRLSDNP